MSVKNTLVRSVNVAGEEMNAHMGTLFEIATETEKIEPELRTADEERILDIASIAEQNVPLINAFTALKAGGLNRQGFPNLAIAPYRHSMEGLVVNVHLRRLEDHAFVSGFAGDTWYLSVPHEIFPTSWLARHFGKWKWKFKSTPIPPVPVELRQDYDEDVFILFEVPVWEELVPADPYLLRHLAGNTYAILASWDLTDKEIQAYRRAKRFVG